MKERLECMTASNLLTPPSTSTIKSGYVYQNGGDADKKMSRLSARLSTT